MKTLIFTILVCIAAQQGIAALMAGDTATVLNTHKKQIEAAMSDLNR